MDTQSKDFLSQYLNNYSPTGHEAQGQQIWLDYIKPYSDTYMSDPYGSVAAIVNPNAPYKVVIEAHADEIAWFVANISEKGYITLKRNGGSDAVIAPSMRAVIHTKKGLIPAIFGWPAIHVRPRDKDEPAPNMKSIFLDVGANNRDEVLAMGIHIGCVATFTDGLTWLNGDRYITGRALDNRMGGFMIAEVLRRIKENGIQLPFALYAVNSVQEEIGLRGAEMISRRIKPDVAIITDVTHDTQSPGYNKEDSDIACGRGPVLSYGAAVHNILLDRIIDTANEAGIAFQRIVAERSTGTDTDSFAYSGEGVPSALISLPLKYMHTTVETVAAEDVEQVINLIYKVIVGLKGNEDYRYVR